MTKEIQSGKGKLTITIYIYFNFFSTPFKTEISYHLQHQRARISKQIPMFSTLCWCIHFTLICNILRAKSKTVPQVFDKCIPSRTRLHLIFSPQDQRFPRQKKSSYLWYKYKSWIIVDGWRYIYLSCYQSKSPFTFVLLTTLE